MVPINPSMALKWHLASSLFSCVLASVSFLTREASLCASFFRSSMIIFFFFRCCVFLSLSLCRVSLIVSSLHSLAIIVVVTIFHSRILGFIQLYIFLNTRLDYPPAPSSLSSVPSLLANLELVDRILLLLPMILTIVLFLFNITFLAMMFRLWSDHLFFSSALSLRSCNSLVFL